MQASNDSTGIWDAISADWDHADTEQLREVMRDHGVDARTSDVIASKFEAHMTRVVPPTTTERLDWISEGAMILHWARWKLEAQSLADSCEQNPPSQP